MRTKRIRITPDEIERECSGFDATSELHFIQWKDGKQVRVIVMFDGLTWPQHVIRQCAAILGQKKAMIDKALKVSRESVETASAGGQP